MIEFDDWLFLFTKYHSDMIGISKIIKILNSIFYYVWHMVKQFNRYDQI
jgi:hypothetical protein